MFRFVIVAGISAFLSFAVKAEAQTLTLSGGITQGTQFSAYSTLTGGSGVVSCDYTLNMASSNAALNSGSGKTVYTFTDATQAQLDGAAMISVFKNLKRRPAGKVYVRASLDCGTFVVDSNTLKINFANLQGETEVTFSKFISHIKSRYDSGV